MKNLLYLYNNGYRAFPQLGKGGLGYKPPFKIIGESIHMDEGQTYYVDDNDPYGLYDHNNSTRTDINPGDIMIGPSGLEYKGDKVADKYIPDDEDDDVDYSNIQFINEETDDEEEEATSDVISGITSYLTKWSDSEPKEKTKLTTTFNKKYEFTKEQKKEIDKIKNNKKLQLDEKIKMLTDYLEVKEQSKEKVKDEDEDEDEQSNEEESLTQDEYDILLKDTETTNMNSIRNKHNLLDRGIAYEYYMENTEKGQQLLKEITETTEQFQDNTKNGHFYKDGNIENGPLMVSMGGETVPKEKVYIYDLESPDAIIELKWYVNKDVCEVQSTKFIGSPLFYTPIFCIHKEDISKPEEEQRIVLYNVWDVQLKKYVYSNYEKKLIINTRLDDGFYTLDITEMLSNGKLNYGEYERLNKTKKQIDPKTKKEHSWKTGVWEPQKLEDGRSLYIIAEKHIDNAFTRSSRTGVWYNITKEQMKKYKPK
jgi:hypothetical protein